MPQISIRDQIKKLVDLQKIDAEIYEYKKQLEEKPAQVQELKEEFEAKKARLNDLEGNAKQVQLKRKESELELKQKEEQIAKYNAQLSQMKTNKEYSTMMHEIEGVKADKSKIEEVILNSYDQSETVDKEIAAEKANVAQEEKKYLAKKSEVDSEVKVMDDRIKVLEGQRNQITPDLDKNLLMKYEKILVHKKGMAIAPVTVGSACGCCFMNVPHQVVNAIKMKTDIIQCEFCQCMLYIEDDL